jgi:hypothetical protein
MNIAIPTLSIGSGAFSWAPAALGALREWEMDPAVASSLTLTGLLVDAIADQSGKGRGLTGSGAARMTYAATDASANGQPSLQCAGAQNMVSATWSPNKAQPVTWVLVAYSSNIAAAQRQCIEGVGGNRHYINQNGTGKIGAGAVSNIGGVATDWPNTLRIVVFEANGASSALYVDSHSTANATGNAGALDVTGVRLGSFNGSGNFWHGGICYAACISGVGAAIRVPYVKYLGQRFSKVVS